MITEETFVEQTHSAELQSISDTLQGLAAQGGIDRELVNDLVEHSAALARIAMLYDAALVAANAELRDRSGSGTPPQNQPS